MKVVSEVRIKDGKLDFKQRSSFLQDVSKFKDGDYVITVEKRKKKRSVEQNRYYWGVIVPLVLEGLTEAGWRYTIDQVHEDLKRDFNIVEIVNEVSGEIRKTIGSTTEMSTSQMLNYFAKITQWAAEYLNVQIPEPGEQLQITI